MAVHLFFTNVYISYDSRYCIYIRDTVCVYIYMYMTEGGGVCVKLMIKGLCMTIKKIISTTSFQQGRGKNEPPPPLQNAIVQFERLCVCDGNS